MVIKHMIIVWLNAQQFYTCSSICTIMIMYRRTKTHFHTWVCYTCWYTWYHKCSYNCWSLPLIFTLEDIFACDLNFHKLKGNGSVQLLTTTCIFSMTFRQNVSLYILYYVGGKNNRLRQHSKTRIIYKGVLRYLGSYFPWSHGTALLSILLPCLIYEKHFTGH